MLTKDSSKVEAAEAREILLHPQKTILEAAGAGPEQWIDILATLSVHTAAKYPEISWAGHSFPSTLPPPPDKEQNPNFKKSHTLTLAYEIKWLTIQYVRKHFK